MEVKISPSLLSADFSCLGKEVQDLDKAGCDYIHVDVMDGHFVKNITIGPCVIKSIRKFTQKKFDVHLMIENVEGFVESFIDAGSDIITFHFEASKNPKELINVLRRCGKKVGISVRPRTDWKKIIPYIELVDLILVMTVEPGFGGQGFIHSQLEKISQIKQYVIEKKLDTMISVDGGIDDETSKLVRSKGADILVSGSYIFDGTASYSDKITSLKG